MQTEVDLKKKFQYETMWEIQSLENKWQSCLSQAEVKSARIWREKNSRGLHVDDVLSDSF